MFHVTHLAKPNRLRQVFLGLRNASAACSTSGCSAVDACCLQKCHNHRLIIYSKLMACVRRAPRT